ncbi:MAG: DUF1822 family protein [Elainellaceae cyanobacterium]
MMSFEDLVAIAPDQVCIPITSDDHKTVTANINRTRYSNEAARQQAYYNLLSLRLLQTWLADTLEIEPPPPWVAEDTLPSVWDVVNGTAIQVEGCRLVVIPNGDRPLDELSVPQEWVDHPDWCGDYYLAIDIDTDQQWLRIVGYTTHALLKQGTFDDIDRTYCMPVDSLIEDLNVLWVGRDLMPNSKPAMGDLPPLGSETARHTICQLGAVKHYSPRLDVPFSQWAALVTHSDYRQALYVERTTTKVIQQVTSWLQHMLNQGWSCPPQGSDRLDGFYHPLVLSAKNAEPDMSGDINSQVVKDIFFDQCKVILSVVREQVDQRIGITVELKIFAHTSRPESLQLIVLDQQGSAFMTKNADLSSPMLKLTRFFIARDEPFSLRLVLGQESVIEDIPPAQ